MKRDPNSRQTLAYSPAGSEGMHIEAFPMINGMKCTGWSATDLFEEQNDAYTLLARIAVSDLAYGEAEDLAKAFFAERNEEPYSYYDPDDHQDEEEDQP